MITRIEAKNFRCLRYVSQPLENFNVLVGPNASGKTTFLDVIGFLGRMVADGLEAAVNELRPNFVYLPGNALAKLLNWHWNQLSANSQTAISKAICHPDTKSALASTQKTKEWES